jgi:hypothetical protein
MDLVIDKPFGVAILAGLDRNVIYARIVNLWVYDIRLIIFTLKFNLFLYLLLIFLEIYIFV